ncbi:MAG: hypothetical protein WC602_00945 [archaeon]
MVKPAGRNARFRETARTELPKKYIEILNDLTRARMENDPELVRALGKIKLYRGYKTEKEFAFEKGQLLKSLYKDPVFTALNSNIGFLSDKEIIERQRAFHDMVYRKMTEKEYFNWAKKLGVKLHKE